MTFQGLQNKIKGVFKGRGYHLGHRPSLDWLLALGFFLALTLLGLFLTITNRPEPSAPAESSDNDSPLFSQTSLDRVVGGYETKREQFDSFLKNPPALVDPSQ